MDLLSGYDSEGEDEIDTKPKVNEIESNQRDAEGSEQHGKRKYEEEEINTNKKIKAITTTQTSDKKKDEEINTNKKSKATTTTQTSDKKKDEEDDDLPPLPDMFEAKEDEVYEDKSKHQGRARTFKHVVGNYATYVHIPVPLDILLESRDALIEQGKKECPNLVPQEEYHISITRTFPLREFQIDPFLERLSQVFKHIRSFPIDFREYEYFTNDEKTRSFLSMRVHNGKISLCSLIARMDEVLSEFKLPTFYEDPRPHTTIAWTLGDITPTLSDIVGQLPVECSMDVTFAVCKIGKWMYKYNLT